MKQTIHEKLGRMLDINRVVDRHRRVAFYLCKLRFRLLPAEVQQRALARELAAVDEKEWPDLLAQAHGACRDIPPTLLQDPPCFRDILKQTSGSYYCMDLSERLKPFANGFRFLALCGDVTTIPPLPTFVKSRPITPGNGNGVLMKLNAFRHYRRVRDHLHFTDKQPTAVWRGKIHPHQHLRISFMQQWHGHALVNAAMTNQRENIPSHWLGTSMSIRAQLAHRYSLSIEGNDVATNLKWILQSSSLCLMPKPRFETWFLESRLQPGIHYVELHDDFSNLAGCIDHYNAHPDEADAIIRQANAYAAPYFDDRRERCAHTLTALKYFSQTVQSLGDWGRLPIVMRLLKGQPELSNIE